MKSNNKKIEELTFNRIKTLGTNEPSADFTQKVMQNILLENRLVNSFPTRNYSWVLIFLPVFILFSCFLLVILQPAGYIGHLWLTTTRFLQPFLSIFHSISIHLKSFSIQSTILISFIAILSLLVIEVFLQRAKHIL